MARLFAGFFAGLLCALLSIVVGYYGWVYYRLLRGPWGPQ